MINSPKYWRMVIVYVDYMDAGVNLSTKRQQLIEAWAIMNEAWAIMDEDDENCSRWRVGKWPGTPVNLSSPW